MADGLGAPRRMAGSRWRSPAATPPCWRTVGDRPQRHPEGQVRGQGQTAHRGALRDHHGQRRPLTGPAPGRARPTSRPRPTPVRLALDDRRRRADRRAASMLAPAEEPAQAARPEGHACEAGRRTVEGPRAQGNLGTAPSSSSAGSGPGRPVLSFGDRPGGVDQADVAERLGEVAEQLAGRRVDLLGEQARRRWRTRRPARRRPAARSVRPAWPAPARARTCTAGTCPPRPPARRRRGSGRPGRARR